MTTDQAAELRAQLVRHEGLRLHAYTDTVGKLTIGVGRNLTDVGISADEAMLLLDHDLARAEATLLAALPWVATLDPVRQNALIDLCFNMGMATLLTFHTTLTAVQEQRWDDAAAGLLRSRYATQVGRRAQTIATMIRTGVAPELHANEVLA